METVILLILDGWGIAPAWGGNAISQARTPNFDQLWRQCPHAELKASGNEVGLPGHEAGNSEVGHLNIGAGRIVYQDISRISQSIKDGSFYNNPVILQAMDQVKKNQSSLHLVGLVSDGGVHSHTSHLFALLDFAKKESIKKVYIHVITDGRDSDPQSALIYVSRLNEEIAKVGLGEIATVCGRFYAMDRDHHWERTQLAYQAMAEGKGLPAESALSAISSSYTNGVTDEFIKPAVITKNNQIIAKISDNDSVIFFNFRADRTRQLAKAFTDSDFKYFPRKKILNLYFVGFIPYEAEEDGKVKSAFNEQDIKNTLAEVINNQNLAQFHIAETEKYAHVTYFFNGGREQQFSKEDRMLIPSPRIATYDKAPAMSAPTITQKLIEKINSDKYTFVVANFANADMVGHSGDFKATVTACEIVDQCIGKIVEVVKKTNKILIVTADHGNADEILNAKTGQINTEHSKNDVPFILFDQSSDNHQYKIRSQGKLADIAPTILQILNISKPAEMTGKSLIK